MFQQTSGLCREVFILKNAAVARGKTTQPTHKWAHLYAFNWQRLIEDGSEHHGWAQRNTCALRLSSEHRCSSSARDYNIFPSCCFLFKFAVLVGSFFPPLLVFIDASSGFSSIAVAFTGFTCFCFPLPPGFLLPSTFGPESGSSGPHACRPWRRGSGQLLGCFCRPAPAQLLQMFIFTVHLQTRWTLLCPKSSIESTHDVISNVIGSGQKFVAELCGFCC